jgi:3-dehydroquinate synthase
VIWDEALFDFLEAKRENILNLDRDSLIHIVKRSCKIKAEVVSRDERESGLRSILNFGHTIGHAIETATEYRRYLHGETVAIGMALEAELSSMLNLIDSNNVTRIKALISSYGLPSEMPKDIDRKHVFSSMELDKKAIAGELRFILPEGIGKVSIQRGVEEKRIREVLQS